MNEWVSEVAYLEDDAEEPGEEDVSGHQPGQLPPVLLAVADPHACGAQRQQEGGGGRPRKQQQQQAEQGSSSTRQVRGGAAAASGLNSGLHQPLVSAITNPKPSPPSLIIIYHILHSKHKYMRDCNKLDLLF